jgi:hypothetical protein
MSSQNDFLDGNIATLHLLVSEKRKWHMLLEEARLTLQTASLEIENYSRQLELLRQD